MADPWDIRMVRQGPTRTAEGSAMSRAHAARTAALVVVVSLIFTGCGGKKPTRTDGPSSGALSAQLVADVTKRMNAQTAFGRPVGSVTVIGGAAFADEVRVEGYREPALAHHPDATSRQQLDGLPSGAVQVVIHFPNATDAIASVADSAGGGSADLKPVITPFADIPGAVHEDYTGSSPAYNITFAVGEYQYRLGMRVTPEVKNRTKIEGAARTWYEAVKNLG